MTCQSGQISLLGNNWLNYIDTRTAGATGPLVLESGGPVVFVVVFFLPPTLHPQIYIYIYIYLNIFLP